GGRVQHHSLAAALRLVDEVLGEIVEVAEHERGDGQGDDPAGPGAQLPCRDLGTVDDLQYRRAHPFAGRVAHMRVVVDDVRDGLDRDARELGDVAQGGRTPPGGGDA